MWARSLTLTHQTLLTQLMLDELTFFDRLNLANCAMQRAKMHTVDADRFHGEYTTARHWTKYKCYITKTVSFVESD